MKNKDRSELRINDSQVLTTARKEYPEIPVLFGRVKTRSMQLWRIYTHISHAILANLYCKKLFVFQR